MSQRNRNVAGTVIGVGMALLGGTVANGAADQQPAEATSRGSSQPQSVRRAINSLLRQLPVEDEPARSGYRRTRFRHWSDLDGDGCDTRQQVLIDESEEGLIEDCEVTEGEWLSIYDQKIFASPGDLDIDHVVALGEAWDSGASDWEDERREDYANDLGYDESLVAVSASSNRSKSDKDPAEWKPPDRGVWCRFATAWTTVKVRWGLAADTAEVDELRSMFRSCKTKPPTTVPKAE